MNRNRRALWIGGGGMVAATEAIIADHERSADSARWFRMGWGALQKHRDGVTLDGGRLWQRIHLWASARGLAMQPLNQMPERSDRETTTGAEPQFTSVLAELVGDPRWKALMPFRLGYPEYPELPSPRRPLESVLVAPA